MKTPRYAFAVIAIGLFIVMSASSSLYGAAGGPGAPWYPDEGVYCEDLGGGYDGKLYIILEDTGKKKVAGKVGNQADEAEYREFVVEIKFILEIETNDGPLYFSGIGKTCEDSVEIGDLPACPAGTEDYYDQFYLPGDYATRVGAALRTFLEETVFPGLCPAGIDCDAFLCMETNDLNGIGGNAEQVVDPDADLPASPWFFVQPVKIVF